MLQARSLSRGEGAGSTARSGRSARSFYVDLLLVPRTTARNRTRRPFLGATEAAIGVSRACARWRASLGRLRAFIRSRIEARACETVRVPARHRVDLLDSTPRASPHPALTPLPKPSSARPSRRHHALLLVAALIAVAAVFPSLGLASRVSSDGALDGTQPRRGLLTAGPCGDYAGWVRRGGWALRRRHPVPLPGHRHRLRRLLHTIARAHLREIKSLEDVAGATFMAAGSSAPELFTSTMSLVSENATNELGVATIVGSAVFNILIIVAATVLFSGRTLRLDWKPVTRDCVFYAAAIAFVLGVMADGRVWWWEGVVSSVPLPLLRRVHVRQRERHVLVRAPMHLARRAHGRGERRRRKDRSRESPRGVRPRGGGFRTRRRGNRGGGETVRFSRDARFSVCAYDAAPRVSVVRGPSMDVPGLLRARKEGWYLVSFASSVVWISGISYGMATPPRKSGARSGYPRR